MDEEYIQIERKECTFNNNKIKSTSNVEVDFIVFFFSILFIIWMEIMEVTGSKKNAKHSK